MTRSALRRATAAIAAVILVAACSATAGSPAASPGAAAGTAEEYAALYRERLAAARTRFTDADVAFMSKMIHHHAQAIEMANLIPERSTSSEMRTLGGRIINAQKDEITLMSRWLTNRGLPVPQVGGPMDHAAMGHDPTDHAAHMAAGGNHGAGTASTMDMPGMLTPEEMKELAAATGTEFDRLFLTGMIRHHNGAVTMVHELFATDGAGQDEEVFKFASDVQVDQATEVARMELMLEALPGRDIAR